MTIEKVALAGNPNSGKSSLFNQLTGLHQHTGNYPGVTIDKKSGTMAVGKDRQIEILDLPGTYSIYPRSEDERVVYDLLFNPDHPDFPDLIVVVVDSSNLERNLLLFTQIYDLKIPVVLALNMIDISEKKGLQLDIEKLSGLLGQTPVVAINARKGTGIDQLKKHLTNYKKPEAHYPFVQPNDFREILEQTAVEEEGQPAPENRRTQLPSEESQIEETKIRYQKIKDLLRFSVKRSTPVKPIRQFSQRLDALVVHPVAGYAIFIGILFLMFQAVYAFAEWPMNLIDTVFLALSQQIKDWMAPGVFTDLLAEGIIPGIGGVVIFIPQIVLLFLFIALLEESGYMARAVFIMDRLMRPFGLNGKSVVPLISGIACAVPAIMATRTIANWKERLITILVTPLMSCAARLPVYTLLIALVIPDQTFAGIFGLKGLTLFGLYFISTAAALLAAVVFRVILKSTQQSFLILELPEYKIPHWKSVVITLWEKTKLFVLEAGKIILAISVILWVLASYGPSQRMQSAVDAIPPPATESPESLESYENAVQSARLENSYIGLLGKGIEPVIEPLGYDWKIGIALITSFAAREVFVGSMATIYSVGEDFEDNETLLKRMETEVNANTGKPVYNLAAGISLMLFYAFAMQCMSTLAIVYRETNSWKWPVIQTIYMTGLAYVAAFIAYQLLK
jgi:ferrous iron transport protein B